MNIQKLFEKDKYKELVTKYELINSSLKGACGPMSLFVSYRLLFSGINSLVCALDVEPDHHTVCITFPDFAWSDPIENILAIDCASNYLVKNMQSTTKTYEYFDIVPNFYSKGVIRNRERYWKSYPKLKTSNPDPIIVKRVNWQKKSNEYTS